MVRVRIVVPLVLLLSYSGLAQRANRSEVARGNLKIRVVYEDSRAATSGLRVQLMGSASSNSVNDGYTDTSGMIEFLGVPVGTYHVVVTGQGIHEADSGLFELDARQVIQAVFVTVRRASGPEQTLSPPNSPTVAAADMNIPKNARKEFDKASELLTKDEWEKAIERLVRAVAIYPEYAAAYNNLGVAYSRLGDWANEREALQKAMTINDHFVPAMVNLARMDIKNHNFVEAEELLERAVAAEPKNVQTLTLLVHAELLVKHYQDAVANCRRVHSMPHQSHALVHYFAARAFEHENQLQDAAAELQTFLQEEPAGPRADQARKELASVEQHLAH